MGTTSFSSTIIAVPRVGRAYTRSIGFFRPVASTDQPWPLRLQLFTFPQSLALSKTNDKLWDESESGIYRSHAEPCKACTATKARKARRCTPVLPLCAAHLYWY